MDTERKKRERTVSWEDPFLVPQAAVGKKAVFEGEPGEYLYNPIGVVHGGFAMTLLDSAMGCAIHSTLAAGERYTTLEVKSNFVRAITVDTGRVRCEGVVVHRGGTVATAEGRLIAIASGKLLAHGTTTCLIVR
ncbi:MAG: PaaI family thioesterase [Chloroflexi bacterium]|nr:MAG: PaaI family thioesterase [Chloroflexota bacterium]